MSYFDNGSDFEKYKQEAVDAKVTEESFYKETIGEKKSSKRRGKTGLLVVGTLFFGTVFGIGLSNSPVIKDYIINPAIEKFSSFHIQNKVPAASTTEVQNIKIEATQSPVVPIAKKVSPAIVAISTKAQVRDWFGDIYESGGTGSGIIIDRDGHIVTNNHVIDGASNISVILSDGKEIPAKILGRDSQSDLAVLKVDQKNLPVAELGDSSKLEVGELAVAIGSPMGTDYAGSVTAGIISGLDRRIQMEQKTLNLIQTDAAINPGNSGGALVNAEGKVIGINTLKLAQNKVEGMGFAIPINEAKPIIEQLIQNKKVVRPILGIAGETISEEVAKQYNVPVGLLVRQVSPLSGADRAGIQRGDIITKIDEEKITSIEDVIRIVQKHKVGDTVRVEIFDQNEKTKILTVKLGASAQE